MKYLIVSGGEVKEGFLTWIVKNGGFDVILAADAGMEALYRDHILPDIIVGDFDSVNPDTLEYFHDKEQIEVCMLNPEKDDTDTEYAIREARRRGAMAIVVIGIYLGFKREFSKLIGFLVVALIAVGLVFNASGVKDVLLELFNKIIGA